MSQPHPADIVWIGCGRSHGFALTSGGDVYAWGQNSSGELGDGSFTDSSTPHFVMSPDGASILAGITAISAGVHCMALRSDGQVVAWGYNYYGELGDGTQVDRPLPIMNGCLSGATLVCAADYHSMTVGLNSCNAPTAIAPSIGEAGTRLTSVRWMSSMHRAQVQFDLATAARVGLAVFDASGRQVAAVAPGAFAAGSHTMAWDGRVTNGQRATRSVYFYSVLRAVVGRRRAEYAAVDRIRVSDRAGALAAHIISQSLVLLSPGRIPWHSSKFSFATPRSSTSSARSWCASTPRRCARCFPNSPPPG